MALLTNRRGTSVTEKTEQKVSAYLVAGRGSKGTTQKSTPIDPKALQFTSPTVEEDDETEEEVNRSTDEFATVNRISSREAIAKRRAIASRLESILEDVIASVGKAKMTTELQLLRRELARSRPQIRELRAERDYLSIVSLVEASLKNVNWKEVSKPQLEQIRESLTIGASNGPVSYSEVSRQARLLRSRGFQTLPVFEFDINDVEGEEESEAADQGE